MFFQQSLRPERGGGEDTGEHHGWSQLAAEARGLLGRKVLHSIRPVRQGIANVIIGCWFLYSGALGKESQGLVLERRMRGGTGWGTKGEYGKGSEKCEMAFHKCSNTH